MMLERLGDEYGEDPRQEYSQLLLRGMQSVAQLALASETTSGAPIESTSEMIKKLGLEDDARRLNVHGARLLLRWSDRVVGEVEELNLADRSDVPPHLHDHLRFFGKIAKQHEVFSETELPEVESMSSAWALLVMEAAQEVLLRKQRGPGEADDEDEEESSSDRFGARVTEQRNKDKQLRQASQPVVAAIGEAAVREEVETPVPVLSPRNQRRAKLALERRNPEVIEQRQRQTEEDADSLEAYVREHKKTTRRAARAYMRLPPARFRRAWRYCLNEGTMLTGGRHGYYRYHPTKETAVEVITEQQASVAEQPEETESTALYEAAPPSEAAAARLAQQRQQLEAYAAIIDAYLDMQDAPRGRREIRQATMEYIPLSWHDRAMRLCRDRGSVMRVGHTSKSTYVRIRDTSQ